MMRSGERTRISDYGVQMSHHKNVRNDFSNTRRVGMAQVNMLEMKDDLTKLVAAWRSW